MSNAFLDWLFPTVPAKFVSRYPLEESVERLRAATVTRTTAALFRQQAYGTVTVGKVNLRRLIPFVGNQFAPRFEGSFRDGPANVVLIGHFTAPGWTKAYSFAPIAFSAVFGVLFCLAALLQPSLQTVWAVLVLPGFAALGIASTKLNQFFTRNDVAWLSQVINGALGEPVLRPNAPPRLGWLKKSFLDLAGQ